MDGVMTTTRRSLFDKRESLRVSEYTIYTINSYLFYLTKLDTEVHAQSPYTPPLISL
jgi:hypothetical protein